MLAALDAAVAGALRAQEAAITRMCETVERAVGRHIDAAAVVLDRWLAILDGVDPARVLRPGYAR